MKVLELKDVTVEGRLRVDELTLKAGRLVGLVGPNGSGKSTLLSVAAGLLDGGGEVRWGGRNLADMPMMERGRRAAWVPQEARFEFGFSVREFVGQGRFAHGDDDEGVEAALDRFDLTELAGRPVNRLSGGERQRVMLARALVTNAPLQFWDEPLAALDVRHGLEVLKLAAELAHAGKTVVMSLHDLRAAHCLDQLILLDRGRLVAVDRPDAVLSPDHLWEIFGVTLREGPGPILELP